MGFVDDELCEVKKLFNNVFPGCRLVSCVPTMVRAEIKQTEFKKLIVCIQFTKTYPVTSLLFELKSKTLSDKLLQGLTNVCEQEIKKYLGKAQVLITLKFLRSFIEEHPLCCCYDEINTLKKSLNDNDEFKLKQKSSSIIIKVHNGQYFLSCRIIVPENYPTVAVDLQDVDTNFTPAFQRHMVCQAKEIARKCVEPPIKKNPKLPPFEPKPSLEKSVEFLIYCVKRIPQENCQFCHKICFPSDPKLLEVDEESPKHIERVYCGHLFHQECFFTYMKMPPFGNKKCSTCGCKIFHYKWSVSDQTAEARWAHKQARERELQEVADFFN